MSVTNEYITAKQAKQSAFKHTVPTMHCVDGFMISVQASNVHYCSPRNTQGPWTEVECGFPNASVPTLSNYKEGSLLDSDTACVFGYVPIELVDDLIASHGGLIPSK